MSRETEAKLTWEYHCVSSQVSRRIVLQGKLFRFRKDGANNTEQGEKFVLRFAPKERKQRQDSLEIFLNNYIGINQRFDLIFLIFRAGKESRNITVGSTEHSTLVLPKLLLRAVSIAEVRATEEIRQLLQQGRDGLQ